MSNFLRLYHTLPSFFQQIICSLEGKKIYKRRFDTTFFEILTDYDKRMAISKDELFAYKESCLIKFIHHAIDNVPYYKQFHKKDFQSAKDILKLSVLTKETVRTNNHLFISKNLKQTDSIISHTSGTTGAGLVFPVSKIAEKHQWAVWWRYRKNLGINFGEKCGIFTGQPIINPMKSTPPFWMSNNSNNEILFSGYHLHINNISHYVDTISKHKIEWLHGYPSNIAMLAKLMSEANLRINHKIKFITTGAESLLSHQKELIETTFNTKVYNHYGLAEGVANISECINGNLHIDEDFSNVELIHISDNNYKIIGTNFHNQTFPLLRYDTGDIATLEDPSTTCDCTHKGRIVSSIDGRKEDYIYLSDNVAVGRLDHLFKDLVHVKQAQIYQKEIGFMDIRIVKDKLYSEHEEMKLISEIETRMGNRIKYKILYVDEISKTSRGKYRFILSDIHKINNNEMVEQ